MSTTDRTSYGAAAKSERELTKAELDAVVDGGKPKPEGSAAGNVAAKWNIAQGAVA